MVLLLLVVVAVRDRCRWRCPLARALSGVKGQERRGGLRGVKGEAGVLAEVCETTGETKYCLMLYQLMWVDC